MDCLLTLAAPGRSVRGPLYVDLSGAFENLETALRGDSGDDDADHQVRPGLLQPQDQGAGDEDAPV